MQKVVVRDIGVAAAVIAALIAAFPFIGGGVLWTRPLWMDENVTVFVVSQPTVRDMVGIIGRGGDWNPPLLHFLLRPLSAIGFANPPLYLRTFAVVCVGLALLFTFAALRRRFSATSSAAGVLAVAAHPIVMQQAFEGRFYAPWLLFAALLTWAVGIDESRDKSLRRDVTIALSAALLCSIHWFGVFSLGLIQLGVLVANRGRLPIAVRLLAPTAVGWVALGISAPLALSQRASATGLGWVLPLSWVQITAMSKLYWIAAVPIAALLIALAVWASRRFLGPSSPITPPHVAIDNAMAAMLGLAGMPVVLIALSAILQPSMVDRYAIVGALAWAPAVAFAAEVIPARVRTLAAAALALVLASTANASIRARAEYVGQVDEYAGAYEHAAALELPVVFLKLHTIYPVIGPSWRTDRTARYLDLPDSVIFRMYPSPKLGWLRHNIELDRDQAKYHAGIFGFPRVARQDELDTAKSFVLLAGDLNLPGGYKQVEMWGRMIFPTHRVTRLAPMLTLFVRP